MIPLPGPVTTETAKATVFPIRMYMIGGSPNLYYTDADVDVLHDSQVYISRGISYSKIKTTLGLETSEHTVTIDNLDNAMITWALATDPTGYASYVKKGFSTGVLNISGQLELIEDFSAELFRGRNTKMSFDSELEITVKSGLDMTQQIGPKQTQEVTCRFKGADGFKGLNCGYAGVAATCNFTITRCRDLGNQERFGGFPALNSSTTN